MVSFRFRFLFRILGFRTFLLCEDVSSPSWAANDLSHCASRLARLSSRASRVIRHLPRIRR